MSWLPLEHCYCDCAFCLEEDKECHGKKHRKEEIVHKDITVHVTRDSSMMGEANVVEALKHLIVTNYYSWLFDSMRK